MSEKIVAYKAMDKNMQCRGKQYEVGKTYHEDKADCRPADLTRRIYGVDEGFLQT